MEQKTTFSGMAMPTTDTNFTRKTTRIKLDRSEGGKAIEEQEIAETSLQRIKISREDLSMEYLPPSAPDMLTDDERKHLTDETVDEGI